MNRGSREKKIPQSQIMKKNGERVKKMHAWQWKGEWGSDEIAMFNLAMENVLKGLPDKIGDQLSRHHTQMHLKKVHIFEWLSNCEIVEMI